MDGSCIDGFDGELFSRVYDVGVFLDEDRGSGHSAAVASFFSFEHVVDLLVVCIVDALRVEAGYTFVPDAYHGRLWGWSGRCEGSSQTLGFVGKSFLGSRPVGSPEA